MRRGTQGHVAGPRVAHVRYRWHGHVAGGHVDACEGCHVAGGLAGEGPTGSLSLSRLPLSFSRLPPSVSRLPPSISLLPSLPPSLSLLPSLPSLSPSLPARVRNSISHVKPKASGDTGSENRNRTEAFGLTFFCHRRCRFGSVFGCPVRFWRTLVMTK